MKDIKQVKTVKKGLKKQKESFLRELTLINEAIDKKSLLIMKMQTYLAEYETSQTLEKTRLIPALHNNYISFTQQIQGVVFQTEKEIDQIKLKRIPVITELDIIEQKIKLMEKFEEKIEIENSRTIEKNNQNLIDELSVNIKIRGAHE